MEIIFYNNHSEHNRLEKNLTNVASFSGTLREETSIISPVVIIETNNLIGVNYAYIPVFERYYFIKDITVVRIGLWRVTLQVDVLQSFSDEIRGITAILSDTENTGLEKYLPGDVWKTKVREITDIKTFPNGLDDDGHFILITAGG